MQGYNILYSPKLVGLVDMFLCAKPDYYKDVSYTVFLYCADSFNHDTI